MKLPFTAASLLCSFLLTACMPDAVYTPVEDLVFADPALRDCVVNEARREGWVDAGHVLTVHCARPSSRKISSLAGIGQLVNLRELFVAGHVLEELAPHQRRVVVVTDHDRVVAKMEPRQHVHGQL